MSIRLRNKDVPDKWYIIVTGKFTNRNGKPVNQKLVPFDGSRSEALVADSVLNNREVSAPYPTLLEILPRFMESYRNNKRPRSYEGMELALKHLLPFYGDMKIPLIDNHHHERYKTERMASTFLPGKAHQSIEDDGEGETEKRRHPAKLSINRELACLKSLLTYAEKQGISVKSRPELFSKRQAGGKAIVPLAPSQLIALLDAVKGSYIIPVMLMVYTGLRLKEAAEILCEDVHLENRTMYVIGKGGAKEAIPIPLPMMSALKKAKEDQAAKGSGWMSINPKTGKPYGDITKHLNTLCKQAGIDKKITHHTLRHSCASALVLAGVALPRVQGILRHSEISTTMIYVHIAARFGVTEETELARKLFWLNVDGIEESPSIDFKKMSINGAMYADSYKTPDDICDILKPRKPA